MASLGPGPSSAGAECMQYDFVSEPPNDFFCPVSLEIMKDPRQTSFCCGHHLSRAVAERLEREGKPCPMCNRCPLKTTDDPYFRRQILALQVRCCHKGRGCEWVGGLGEIEKHLSVGVLEGECGLVAVACPLECGALVKRKSLDEHKTRECIRRPFVCEYCDYTNNYKEVVKHKQVCDKALLKCPNECESDTVERRHLKRHLTDECPLQDVDCEFSYAGCTGKIKRRKMQEHMEENTKRHLDTLASYTKKTVDKLQSEQQMLQSQVQSLFALAGIQKERIPSFSPYPECTLDNVEENVQERKRWYSSPFYTHIGGYKMCLSIDVYGWVDARGIYVSVCFCMMRGEFDDCLKWPFRGDIKVQLLDQREGGEHFERQIVDESAVSQYGAFDRVPNGNECGHAWGIPNFISHADLYKPEEGKEYLKNDTLKFRVKIVVISV